MCVSCFWTIPYSNVWVEVHRKGMRIMLHLSWVNCWFARAASVHAEFAASDELCLKSWIAYIQEQTCSILCLWQDGEKPFLPPSIAPPNVTYKLFWGVLVLLPSAHANLMVLCNIIWLVCTNSKIRKRQNVVLLSWVQLKRIFMWILLCCYNLPLFDSSFERTGTEGKLGWTKDHPGSLPASSRLGLTSVIDNCSLT